MHMCQMFVGYLVTIALNAVMHNAVVMQFKYHQPHVAIASESCLFTSKILP